MVFNVLLEVVKLDLSSFNYIRHPGLFHPLGLQPFGEIVLRFIHCKHMSSLYLPICFLSLVSERQVKLGTHVYSLPI